MSMNHNPAQFLMPAFLHHLLMPMVQFTAAVFVAVVFMEYANGPVSAAKKGQVMTVVALAGGTVLGMGVWVGIGWLFRRLPVRCRLCQGPASVTDDSWTKATYTCGECGKSATFDTPTPP